MEKLRQYLKDNNLTATRFARDLDIQPSTVLRQLAGKNRVSTRIAILYHHKTGISLVDLFFDESFFTYPSVSATGKSTEESPTSGNGASSHRAGNS